MDSLPPDDDRLATKISLVANEPYWLQVQQAEEPVLVLDDAQFILMANASAGVLLDRPVEELVGLSFQALMRPVDEEDNPLLPPGACFRRTQYLMVNTGGGRVQLEAISIPVHFKGEAATQVVLQDVTSYRQAETDLRETEERYRRLTENAADAICVVIGGNIAFFNKAGAELLGAESPGDLFGTSLFDFIVPENRDRARERLRLLFEEEMVLPLTDSQVIRLDGKRLDVEILATPITLAGQPAAQVVIRDITARKQAEEALKKSEMRYRSVVEDQTEFILRALPDGTLTFVNETLCRTYGLSRKALIGKNFYDFLPEEEDKIQVRKRLDALIPEDPVITSEQRVLLPDGQTCWHQWTDRAFFDEQKQLIGFQSVGRDVTERRRLEAAIMNISEREQHRLGHDLHDDVGQLLNGAWFTSDLLRKKLERRHVQEAEQAVQLTGLLAQAISRIRGLVKGLNAIEFGPDDFVPALRELAAGIEEIYAVRSLRCRVNVPKSIEIKDKQAALHLFRITQESVSNAIKHSEATQIDIQVVTEPDVLTLTITDNGIGIKEPEEGSEGFGLRIMQYRARLIRGTVAIRRGESGGTIVSCIVPA